VRYGAERTRQVAGGLFLVYMVTLGLGLLPGGRFAHALLLLALAAAFAYHLRQRVPNPKRILIPASLYMLAGLLSGLLPG